MRKASELRESHQMDRRQFVSGAALGAVALTTPSLLRAQGAPIRLGEINSYTAQPAFT
jgi:branched-chain amino acid transport system substrate-binding protein